MKTIYVLLGLISLLLTQLYGHAEKHPAFLNIAELSSSHATTFAVNKRAEISVVGGVVIATSPICTGTSAIIALNGHTGSIQWQDSTAGVNFRVISGAGTSSYRTVPLTATRWFRAKVSNGTNTAYSNIMEVVVKNPPIGTISGPANVSQPFVDSAPGFPLIVTSNSGGLIYMLYKDRMVQSAIGVETANGYQYKRLKDAGTYTVKAHWQNLPACSSDLSGSFVIAPSLSPIVYTISGGLSACEGSVALADIYLSGSEVGVVYTLGNTSQSKMGTGASLNFSMEAIASNNGDYIVMAKNTITECETVMNGMAIINMQRSVGQPEINGESVYCNRSEGRVMGTVSNATQLIWSIAPTSAGTINYYGLITWNSLYTGLATITLTASNSSCGEGGKTATFATLVESPPTISLIQGDSAVCLNDVIPYQVVSMRDLSYNWSIDMNVKVELNRENGTIVITYLEDVSQAGGKLTVTPQSAACGMGEPMTHLIMRDLDCGLNSTEIVEEFARESIRVFPNPAESHMEVSSSLGNILGIDFSDLSGKKMLFLSAEGKSTKVDVSQLAKGLYLLTVKGENTVLVTKFYKQ